MKTVYSLKSIYCIVLSALFFVFTNTAFAQTLTSDTSDYAPGSTVLLNGSGFSFGEPVVVQVLHDDMMGGDDSLEAHQPWEVMADSFGNFTTSWYVFEYGDQQGANLVAVADGQSSFLHAEAFFTDAATPPVCNISGNFTGCAGSTRTYTGPTGIGFTYTWTILNNNTGASFSGSSTSMIANVNIGNTPGTFTIQLKVNSGAPFLICSQSVTVIGNPSCSITPATPVCPGTQNSYSGAAGASAYSWSISGNGTLSGASNSQSATVNAASVCNGNYTLTLTSSLNGCSSICSQLINVRDNTPPSITQLGASYTISCGDNPVFTEPTASDNCSTPTIVLVSDVTTPGSCSGSYIRTKSWKAVDGCSNQSGIVSQTINVIDNVVPSIENPDNDGAVIACHETPVFNAPAALDGCDANPSVVVVSDVTTSGDCPGTYSRTVCWRAVDCSGNQSEQVCKTVNVIDDEAPSISDPGEDMTIACPGSPQFTAPVATDGCDESPVVILVSDVTEEGDAPGAYTRTLCWKAVDCSGNESNTVCETISVINNTPASIGAPVTACDSYTLPWGEVVTSTNDYSHSYTTIEGCTNVETIHVTINHSPVLQPAPGNVVCSGSVATMDAGAGYASYLWSTGETTQSISASEAGTYNVTVTNSDGCVANASRTLNVNANPIPAITGNNVVCSGSNATFDAGSGYAGYAWSTGATTQTISANTSGTYTVTVTSSNGCNGSATRSLSVNANPSPAITGNNVICSGSSSTFDAGSGYSSYTWSTGATTQTIAVSTAGSYTVTVTNSSGCNASATNTLTVNSGVTASASSNPGCVGTTLNLTSSGGSSYSWTGPNGFTSSLQNPGISNVSTSAAGTYVVIVTNSSGCTATASASVSVYSNPTVSASSNSPVVGGNTTNLNSSGGSTYSWVGPDDFTSTSQNPSIMYTAAAMEGTYTVTVSNSNGCTATATTAVDVTCSGFKSYTITQGGWGANANGNNPAVYRDAHFPSAFPNGLTVGCGSNWLNLTTSLSVQDFLPSGGTAGVLTQCYTNPGGSLSNVLAGQVVALTLNVGFDNNDPNFSSATSMHLQDLYVKSGTFMGWTVLQVLNEAQRKLGGCSSSYTATQLNSACTSINENYDGGKTDKGFLSCTSVRMSNEPWSAEDGSVKLYPNPSNGVFVVELAIDAESATSAEIQVVNILGQYVYTDHAELIDGKIRKEIQLDNGMSDGSYIVRIIAGDQTYSKQIIFQK